MASAANISEESKRTVACYHTSPYKMSLNMFQII